MPEDYPLLSSIHEPHDLRGCTMSQLDGLAKEVRELIIEVVSRNGGHLASNLGAVELTIALHRVFDSPIDKIIWDVGHQCYTHKILTGRRELFPTLRKMDGLSGFPKTDESPHDIVETGHASTSISAALGVLVAKRMKGSPGKVVAIIGDGALTGGVALEGLNQAGHLKKDLIIIINDNAMSIGRNVGALSAYLSRLTTTSVYRGARRIVISAIRRIPVLGNEMVGLIRRLEKSAQTLLMPDTLFFDFGFSYVGPVDGHNIPLLLRILRNVKKLDQPCVVHVQTKKGKGYPPAEANPTEFHGVSPFNLVDGKLEPKEMLTYTEAFSSTVTNLAGEDSEIVAISAAMTDGTGLRAFQNRFPARFFDVGISEQHAVTFAAGLARGGMKPLVAIYSTFLQRAVDQVIHDVALPDLPVVIAVDRAGLVGGDGETHQGFFDIPLFRSVPNLTFIAPTGQGEMQSMLHYAFQQAGPVMIRYPKSTCLSEDINPPIETGRGVFAKREGCGILLMALGSMLSAALEASALLEKRGVLTDVYNIRFVKPLDEEHIVDIASAYDEVFVVEEGFVRGGLGEYLHSLLGTLPVRCLGVPDRFVAQGTRQELLSSCGLDAAGIAASVELTQGVQVFRSQQSQRRG